MSWFEQRTYHLSVLSLLIILVNFDHFVFWPIAQLSVIPLLCGHFQTGYSSRLPVPAQRDRVINGLKLSRLVFRVTPNF